MNATDVIWEFFEAHPKALSPTAATPARAVAKPVAGGEGREIVFSSQLAFMANNEGNFEIYVMDVSDADNVEQSSHDWQRLTNIPADDYNPDWRPQPKDKSRSE